VGVGRAAAPTTGCKRTRDPIDADGPIFQARQASGAYLARLEPHFGLGMSCGTRIPRDPSVAPPSVRVERRAIGVEAEPLCPQSLVKCRM
jgi:hypothetical protein